MLADLVRGTPGNHTSAYTTSLSGFTANFIPNLLPLLDDPFDYALVIVRTPLFLPALQTPAQPQPP
jgi:hypothetical protein